MYTQASGRRMDAVEFTESSRNRYIDDSPIWDGTKFVPNSDTAVIVWYDIFVTLSDPPGENYYEFRLLGSNTADLKDAAYMSSMPSSVFGGPTYLGAPDRFPGKRQRIRWTNRDTKIWWIPLRNVWAGGHRYGKPTVPNSRDPVYNHGLLHVYGRSAQAQVRPHSIPVCPAGDYVHQCAEWTRCYRRLYACEENILYAAIAEADHFSFRNFYRPTFALRDPLTAAKFPWLIAKDNFKRLFM